MFEKVETAPPDPILGLTEAFKSDTRENKINLSVGVFVDDTGKTPILSTVKEAERRLVSAEGSKSYKPITGDPVYGRLVRELLFGTDHAIIKDERAVTAHTPGGTGALRVAGDFIARQMNGASIWLSNPTWANHPAIFKAAGVNTQTYNYYDAAGYKLDFDGMMESLKTIPAGDVILLHGCCHNPTGVDPSAEQWGQIGRVLSERGVLPLVDFAYQGFGRGIEEDAAGLHALAEEVNELIICSSFSKNFGLYCERVGALTLVAGSKDAAAAIGSQMKVAIRSNYSNPPAHGGAIVATVLGDEKLRVQWMDELGKMRQRINGVRETFVKKLAEHGVERDFSFLTHQLGMFSFSGLTKEQVGKLKDEHAIYIVGSGRINVAGITASNVDRLCEAIAAVL